MRHLRKYFIYAILTLFLLPACGRYSHTVKTVKPKSRLGYYNPKKDRYKKRLKVVRKKVP